MATKHRRSSQVASSVPKAGKNNMNKGNTKVAGPSVKHISADKMANVPGVTLGTTKGRHDVNHPC